MVVAGLVTGHVAAGRVSVPYLANLLRYEEAMMVVEAGPRVWRGGRPGEGAGGRERYAPETGEGTVLFDLAYDLPTVLPKLLPASTDAPPAPAPPTKLPVAL